MEKTDFKKALISYVLTSFIIFFLTAVTSMLGVYGSGVGGQSFRMSVELMIMIQLVVVLGSNLLLHLIFYFGGFHASPIAKGVGIGAVLGVAYFLVTMFALNTYNVNTDSMQILFSAMSGRIIEYGSGGILTAIISVSDIGRWGLLRAF